MNFKRSAGNCHGESPADLLKFINAYIKNLAENDSRAIIPFFANRVEDYFGTPNATKPVISDDRVGVHMGET